MASTGFLARLGEALLCNGLLPGTDFPAGKSKPQSAPANVNSESQRKGH
jgi:hypothetical protein